MRVRLLLALLPLLAPLALARDRGVVIEDFEAPTLALASYPEQDVDPDDWALTGDAYAGAQALRLFGNTWKVQLLETPVALTDTTVWQVAVRVDRIGEIQALGLGDGTSELFYTFWGTQLQEATNWWTVYQGAYDRGEWRVFLLPVGEDWRTTFGGLPAAITQLVYVNDADGSAQPGVTYFDDLRDVTEDLPHAPRCRILSSVQEVRKAAAGLLSVDVQFTAKVFDPDSQTFTFAWDFGDSTTSDLAAPFHTFLVQADHPWTVGLVVTDPEGLAGGDTCRVRVEDGPSALPLTVNFVGDVFTGRGYETPGGIIDTDGVEALFAPTLDIFGRAADVNVANLEVAYTDRGTPHPTKSVVFRSEPENIVGLAYAGIDVVTIGNNHIIDYGEIGMLDTIDGLVGLGIGYCGAGVNEYFALSPVYHGAKGLRLGFVGQCNRTGRQLNYQPFLDAGYSKPGFAYLLPDNLAKAIADCRGESDVVIVQSHSGPEYAATPPEREGELTAPPPVEASEPVPGAPEFHFRNEPTPGDRELRRLALDLGADVVINHHPHVLQGFEAHAGKLIAHSLGNFVFDLYYPETMPTMVLTLEIGAAGITGYTFTPAFINHWIPEPAVGTLARHIVERLADYSRPMNALVVPEADGLRGRVFLSRADVDSTVLAPTATVAVTERDGSLISAPLPVGGDAYFAGVAEVLGEGGGWEVRWGRDLLWFGGFELEGADLWDTNGDDEWLDTTVFLAGARSLALRRAWNSGSATGTDLERHLPCDPMRAHSAVGWLRGENAPQAQILARFYNGRTNETPIASTGLDEPRAGDFDWTQQWRDLDTPDNAIFFELRCNAQPPDAGTGVGWFDELALIEWEAWQAADAPLAVTAPNNVRFLQVRRAGGGAAEAIVVWREIRYADAATAAPAVVPAARPARLVCYPNPCNPRTTVRLDLPARGARDCEVALFDLRGRRVALLYRGALAGVGPPGFTWDGCDDAGRALASGIYLVRANADGRTVTGKVVLVR